MDLRMERQRCHVFRAFLQKQIDFLMVNGYVCCFLCKGRIRSLKSLVRPKSLTVSRKRLGAEEALIKNAWMCGARPGGLNQVWKGLTIAG
jgi:hypothetical protein